MNSYRIMPTFYYFASREDASLSVRTVGYDQCGPTYRWGPSTRAHYLLQHILRGRWRYTYNGTVYILCPGDTFVSYPGAMLQLESEGEGPFSYFWIGFVGSEAPQLLSHLSLTNASPVRHTGEDAALNRLHQELCAVSGSAYSDSLAMTGKLYAIFAQLLRKNAPVQAHGNTLLQRTLEVINARYNRPLTVESICREVGVSRSWLYRIFKTEIGISPEKYITILKINHARALLANTSLRVAEVAYALGYSDPLYFSRCFREAVGMPPSAFRAQLR